MNEPSFFLSVHTVWEVVSEKLDVRTVYQRSILFAVCANRGVSTSCLLRIIFPSPIFGGERAAHRSLSRAYLSSSNQHGDYDNSLRHFVSLLGSVMR